MIIMFIYGIAIKLSNNLFEFEKYKNVLNLYCNFCFFAFFVENIVKFYKYADS